MASVCLPSDALSQHLPSYLGFSYLGRGVSLHGCSSKAQPLLLTLDQGYLLMAAPSDLKPGLLPLGPATTPWPWGSSSQPLSLTSEVGSAEEEVRWPLASASDLGAGVAPLGCSYAISAWCSRSPPLTLGEGLLLMATLLRGPLCKIERPGWDILGTGAPLVSRGLLAILPSASSSEDWAYCWWALN